MSHVFSISFYFYKCFLLFKVITIIFFFQLFRHLFKLNNRLISLLIEFKRNLVTILLRLNISEIKYHIGFTFIGRGTSLIFINTPGSWYFFKNVWVDNIHSRFHRFKPWVIMRQIHKANLLHTGLGFNVNRLNLKLKINNFQGNNYNVASQ